MILLFSKHQFFYVIFTDMALNRNPSTESFENFLQCLLISNVPSVALYSAYFFIEHFPQKDTNDILMIFSTMCFSYVFC